MPNSKGRRRRFGSIRKLPSGRYQARYSGPDGVDRPADDTSPPGPTLRTGSRSRKPRSSKTIGSILTPVTSSFPLTSKHGSGKTPPCVPRR